MIDGILLLAVDDILESHAFQIRAYGGDDGLRDAGLLESAIAQPQASFGGDFLHVFPFEMAAAYLFHLVMNHPFVDGNKRVGLEAALIFLEINEVAIEATDEELVQLVLDTTSSKVTKQDIANFFESHHVSTD
ncbi:type II toxin-antitoxin system death-on-curing family toxin [Novipirellula artificiosorum]|uniref:Toxin Doc n=1 Tax=Novipirellula artificiosorum TaxID=2528016 RepID=A0A5C6DRG0_9BACT|nr:type II toxin-antitoxin system death-on-curing family toxin [Novipirellula artificiosorum]TWU39348.1 Toxin Doc [Novipirellula artificiosorum]